MLSKEVKDIIPVIQQYFTNKPIEYAYLFGSCSRGEETKDSDIDLLVRLSPSASVGLFEYVDMAMNLQDIIGRKVDLVEEDGVADFAKPYVNNDKIKIYERTH